MIMMMLLSTQLVVAKDVIDNQTYLSQTKQVSDNVWIGGQPTEQDFKQLNVDSIDAVINTRTATEVEQLNFNESKLTSELGLTYDLLEVGKGHPYSPAKLAEFNTLMQSKSDQNILLHCRSGNRATQLYTAWLIKYQGQSEKQALEAIGSSEKQLNEAVKTLLGQ